MHQTGDPPLTSARLVELLAAAVAGLERQAQRADSGSSAGSGSTVDAAEGPEMMAVTALTNLTSACQYPHKEAAIAGAGRVPLPWPSADVAAALDGLARLIASGLARGGGPLLPVAACALAAVHALVFHAPQRAAVLARHGGTVQALVGALSAGTDAVVVQSALFGACSILSCACTHPAAAAAGWRDGGSERGASLRALAAAAAGAFAALVHGAASGEGVTPRVEEVACSALTAALSSCPAAHRPALRAAVAQPGVAAALCARVARAAAAVRAPGAVLDANSLPSAGALTVVAELCAHDPVEIRSTYDDGAPHEVEFVPYLDQPRWQPGGHPLMERLLAAPGAPLLGRVVDVVAAGAPWYSAVTAALGADGPAAAGGGGANGGAGGSANGGAGGTDVVAGFQFFSDRLWTWAVGVLELVPVHALTAAAAGGSPIVRVSPALLGLVEAAQAVAGALPRPGLELEREAASNARFNSANLAAAAARVFCHAVMDLGGAAGALAAGAPGAVAALVRLSALEPPLLAAAGGARAPEAAAIRLFFGRYCHARFRAAHALEYLAYHGAQRRVAALLAASPALAAALGAAAGATAAERRFARGDAEAALLVAKRRARIASLLAQLARGAAGGAGGSGGGRRRRAGGDDTSWLRGLAT